MSQQLPADPPDFSTEFVPARQLRSLFDRDFVRPFGTDSSWPEWASRTPDAFGTAVQRSLAEPPPIRRVITAEGLGMLKDQLFREEEPAAMCPITHAPFQIGEHITTLPCSHRFSPSAIRRWVTEEKPECPICRFSLPHTEESNLLTATTRVEVAPLRRVRTQTQLPETATMIIRTRTLQRSIEDNATELRGLGYEPYIVPNYTGTRTRVSLRNRVSVSVPELRSAPPRVSDHPPVETIPVARHSELLNEALALTLEAMIR